jgi:hypothetical protein
MQVFAQWVIGSEHLQFAHDQLMVTERKTGVESGLERGDVAPRATSPGGCKHRR